ncbi:MAG: FtsQ-type POTRA domain-containing protein [Bacillota bacterium]|nr:FtsQ-type POTRA domain-containing protein [Bacillota bacterium]
MTADKKPQVLFLWLLLVVAGGLGLSQSAYFTVQAVHVAGLRQLKREEVLSVAGISLPANVFALNPRVIQARLAEYPPVAKARVVRRFPAELRIELVEREAVGALPYGEHFLLFDGAGVPFAIRQASGARSLPKVTGCRLTPVRLGKPARGEDLRWVAAVLQSLPRPLYQRLSQVEVGRGLTLTLVTEDGVRALLGSREQIERKLGLLQSILAEAETNGWLVREIDVRNPERPFLRQGGENAGESRGESGR